MDVLKSPKPLSHSTQLRIGLLIILIGFFSTQWFSFSAIFLLVSVSVLILGSLLPSRFSKTLLILLIVSLNYALWRDTQPPNPLMQHENEVTTLQGIITSFPDQRIDTNRNYVQITKIISPTSDTLNTSPKILLITSPEKILHYGTEIRFTGKITKPRNFQDFDYQKYLDRFEVSHIIRNPKNIEIISTDQGSWLLRKAEFLRNYFEQNLEQNLSTPHSTIAMGILLGVKKELPPPIQEDFQDSGLMHILVVSGFNISVIMILCNYLFRRFGPIINTVLSIGIILFFVLMTGAEAPVVRAAIMGSLVGLAISSGRFSESRNVVLLSAVIIGIINPKVIQADLGFFFSFAATMGIITLVPILTPHFQWLTNRLEFRNIFLVTLASQIAVFPIQTYFFHQFPTGGLLANQLTEPVIPLAMFFSSVIAVLGFLPHILQSLISIPAWFTLQILLSVADIFANFPTIPVSSLFSAFSGTLLIGFFLWANSSQQFQEKYLRKSSLVIK